MDGEELITRDELTAYLFTVADIHEDVAAIHALLKEDDGEEPEEEA